MFIRTAICCAAIAFALQTGGRDAAAADLDAGYLHATWVLNNENCADPGAERITFRDNGAFENMRAGKLQAAGFWVIEGDIVEAQLVASPAFFRDYFQEAHDLAEVAGAEGNVNAFRLRIIPLNREPDRFDAVGLLGDQVAQAVFRRCGS